MKVVCAECMKMCGLGGKNLVVKGLSGRPQIKAAHPEGLNEINAALV